MKPWEDKIRKVVPYVPGEQPNKAKMIKLNTNENPYPPSPAVKKALSEFNYERLRLYPDPLAGKLVNAIAEYHKVDPDQVFVGVGSDDVIAMMFLTFFNSDKPILFPDISYSFYSVWADLFRIPYETPALDDDFHIVREDYYRENGGIIFPNPNAPTSLYEDLSFVEDVIKHNRDVIVIVDEAYIDFGGKSALGLVEKYDNLMVVQTYSKSRSMAGMRVGYVIANPKLIKYLNDVKHSFNSYTMDQPSIEFGVESIKDEAYFRKTTGRIMETREKTKKELAALGFTFPEPMANFIFATHEKYPAKELFQALREKDIYVRYFSAPRIDNYLRITIGTDEEMDQLIAFLKEYINIK